MKKNADGSVTLTREELYRQVWSTPTSVLAVRYGLSDRGLAKLCERVGIPRPGRGYWAKRRNGKRAQRTPLRPTKDRRAVSITIRPQPAAARRPSRKVERTILVPEAPLDPHPLIVRTEKSLRSARPAENGLVSPRAKVALRVSVAPANIDRATRILDTLVKALEQRTYTVEAALDKNQRPITTVVIAGESIELRLLEKTRRVVSTPDPKSARQAWQWRRRPSYQPTGALALQIVSSTGSGARRTWSDMKRCPLERRLDSFVAALEATAQDIKRLRRHREKTRRRWEILEKRRAERRRLIENETQRIRELEDAADAWHRSQRIRSFVEAVQRRVRHPSGQPARYAEDWLRWATDYADQLDPLAESPASVVEPKSAW